MLTWPPALMRSSPEPRADNPGSGARGAGAARSAGLRPRDGRWGMERRQLSERSGCPPVRTQPRLLSCRVSASPSLAAPGPGRSGLAPAPSAVAPLSAGPAGSPRGRETPRQSGTCPQAAYPPGRKVPGSAPPLGAPSSQCPGLGRGLAWGRGCALVQARCPCSRDATGLAALGPPGGQWRGGGEAPQRWGGPRRGGCHSSEAVGTARPCQASRRRAWRQT